MKTTKPISTISYNSFDFLKMKMDALVRDGQVSFYYFIPHFGEFDEITQIRDKNHIHLYIEPASAIDTIRLDSYFYEYENGDFNSKPLKCMPFRNSKTYDALLYNLHNIAYLEQKFELKEFHYKIDECITNDIDYLKQLYSEALHSDIFKRDRMLSLMDNGVSISEMCFKGLINPAQAYQLAVFEKMYQQGRMATIERKTTSTKSNSKSITEKKVKKSKKSS